MTTITTVPGETATIIGELARVADVFAARAQEQEVCRDRVRAGTAAQHVHAHSATLWRSAEGSLRARIRELEVEPATSVCMGAPSL